MKKLTLFTSLIVLGFLPWSASALIYSGSDLSGLQYIGEPGDAQYVAGTPDLAKLSTPDSGVNGDAPSVFVLGPLGTLSSFSASYSLYGDATGPSSPYWNIKVSPTGGFTDANKINIIAMGGSTLDGSSAIHAYDANWAPLGTWGMTLSDLGNMIYNTYTINDMTVIKAGVEIGDWDNSSSVAPIPATANIESITINGGSSVPDAASSALLLGLGLGSLVISGYRRNRRAMAK